MITEKQCTKCKEVKPITSFHKDKYTKLRIKSRCIDCIKNIDYDYHHTKSGLVTRIYGGQVEHSKRRNHKQPEYTKHQLKDWLFNQSLFHKLFDNWIISGFNKNVTPSCDRTRDDMGYSLDRLQLMTWQENNIKGCNDRKNRF